MNLEQRKKSLPWLSFPLRRLTSCTWTSSLTTTGEENFSLMETISLRKIQNARENDVRCWDTYYNFLFMNKRVDEISAFSTTVYVVTAVSTFYVDVGSRFIQIVLKNSSGTMLPTNSRRRLRNCEGERLLILHFLAISLHICCLNMYEHLISPSFSVSYLPCSGGLVTISSTFSIWCESKLLMTYPHFVVFCAMPLIVNYV